IEEAWEYVRDDIVPGGTKANLDFVNPCVQWGDGVSEDAKLVLSDAQTSGGMLISVPKEKEASLVSSLKNKGVLHAVIGEIVAGKGIEVYRG
ncbi:MAG: AIR synthase-related protein, partial [Deltaproteobacteria bacterium]